MAVGASPHDRILDIHGRHFVESAKAAGLGPTTIAKVIHEVRAVAANALEDARSKMPPDFPDRVHRSVAAALEARSPRLSTADEML